jgi:aryl-alcohol dehydrogenase-like predicted oxidoreductase
METLVQQGKVIYVGSSNFAGWHIAATQAAAATRHFIWLVSEQSKYNLKDRAIEVEVSWPAHWQARSDDPLTRSGSGRSSATAPSWRGTNSSAGNSARRRRTWPGCCTIQRSRG